MLQYIGDKKSREKIPVVYMGNCHAVEEDWIKYEDFIQMLENGKAKAIERKPEFKNNPIFIFPMAYRNDDDNPNIEYWMSRLETDVEFKKRIDDIDGEEDGIKEREIKRMKEIAEKHGWLVNKKE